MKISPKFLLIGLVLLFFILGGLVLRYTGNNQAPIPTNETISVPTTNQSVRLSFHEEPGTYSQNSQLVVKLDADSDTEVNGLQFVISYDPTIVSFIDAKPGPFFASPMVFAKKADDTSKLVIFALGSLTPKSGQGTVAEITFQPKKTGNAVFSLESKSKASPQNGDPVSVLLPDNKTYVIANK